MPLDYATRKYVVFLLIGYHKYFAQCYNGWRRTRSFRTINLREAGLVQGPIWGHAPSQSGAILSTKTRQTHRR